MNYAEVNTTPVLLNVGAAHHEGDWNFQDVSSPFTRIHFIRSGTARMLRGAQTLTLRPGFLYLTPPFLRHSYENVGPLDLVYLHIYLDSGGDSGLFERLDLPTEVAAGPDVEAILSRLLALHPGRALTDFDPQRYDNEAAFARTLAGGVQDSWAVGMETEGLLRLLLARFLAEARERSAGPEDLRISAALRYIREHLSERISMDDLSGAASLSKDHFIRLFSREIGITPGRYINLRKIEAAQLRLLLHPGESVKSIAIGLGFDNLQYFNRLFARLTGESPGRYRQTQHA